MLSLWIWNLRTPVSAPSAPPPPHPHPGGLHHCPGVCLSAMPFHFPSVSSKSLHCVPATSVRRRSKLIVPPGPVFHLWLGFAVAKFTLKQSGRSLWLTTGTAWCQHKLTGMAGTPAGFVPASSESKDHQGKVCTELQRVHTWVSRLCSFKRKGLFFNLRHGTRKLGIECDQLNVGWESKSEFYGGLEKAASTQDTRKAAKLWRTLLLIPLIPTSMSHYSN